MKKFKYKAESFLKFLRFQRESVLTQYKKAQDFKKKLENQYQWMENEMKKAYKDNEKIGQEHRSVHFISDNNQFISMLKAQMESLSIEMLKADEEVAKAYLELQKMQMEIKKIERHKELEQGKFDKQRKKKLQKQFDEINSTRMGGKNAKSV